MKGSHLVENYIEWIMRQDKQPLETRLHFAKEIKKKADDASLFGRITILEITHHQKVVAALKFYDDGSLEFGYPEGAKWGTGEKRPPFFPMEKELV